MTNQDVAKLLRTIADNVARGDSLEGNVEWLMGDEPGEVVVHGAVRVGNLQGHGCYVLIGHHDQVHGDKS